VNNEIKIFLVEKEGNPSYIKSKVNGTPACCRQADFHG